METQSPTITNQQIQQPQQGEEKPPLQPITNGHQYDRKTEYLSLFIQMILKACLLLFVYFVATTGEFGKYLDMFLSRGEIKRYYNNHGVEVFGVHHIAMDTQELHATDNTYYVSWRTKECNTKRQFEMKDVESGYLELNGYVFGSKNVSLSELSESMDSGCPVDSCKCICSFHVGICGNF